MQSDINRIISKWVADNYGGEEANNPSWNIEALSDHLEKELLIVTDQSGEVTTHDIKANGHQYILEWTRQDASSDEPMGYIAITEACNDEPCDWFVNKATTPSWCCNTHMYDGTGDYPTKYDEKTKGEHPTECPFAESDTICDEHETYDFKETN